MTKKSKFGTCGNFGCLSDYLKKHNNKPYKIWVKPDNNYKDGIPGTFELLITLE